MSWKGDTCGAAFDIEDIPETSPKCGTDDSTFSLIDEDL